MSVEGADILCTRAPRSARGCPPGDRGTERTSGERTCGAGPRELSARATRSDGRTDRPLSRYAAQPDPDRVDLSARGRRGRPLASPERVAPGRRARQGARGEGLGCERRGPHAVSGRAEAHVREPRLDEGPGRHVPRAAGRRHGGDPAHAPDGARFGEARDHQGAEGRRREGDADARDRHQDRAGQSRRRVRPAVRAAGRVRPAGLSDDVLSLDVRLSTGLRRDGESPLVRSGHGGRRRHLGRWMRLGGRQRLQQQLLRRRWWWWRWRQQQREHQSRQDEHQEPTEVGAQSRTSTERRLSRQANGAALRQTGPGGVTAASGA
jgi:hypothetical protein